MVENRTVAAICLFLLTCQIIIWRTYLSWNSREIFTTDGISDPSEGLKFPRTCKGNSSSKSTSNNSTEYGGHFKPRNCQARDRVAVIVPYRDREEHLKDFLAYIHPFLQLQLIEYTIFVVELAMPTTFNRGLLANVGFLEAKKSGLNFTCYIVHDVDLLPAEDRNLYVCSDGPRHMSTSNSNYIYKLPYENYVGGVISFPPSAYTKINGFSNLYFGWGGEDDDLRSRISEAGYTLQRVPEDVGIYNAMSHGVDKHNQVNPFKYKLLDGARERMRTDGLSSVKYKLLKVEKLQLYTWVYVQVNQTDYTQPST